jgi:muramoyltetrapeptide carboxypeptidase
VTLLIDPPNSPGHGRLWSHLASDESFEELHRFAEQLGIPQRGFDRDHYDIPAERYDKVVAAGATPVTSRELISRLRAAGLRRRKADVLAPRRAGRTLVRPERLRPGSRVAVVSPSGPVPDAPLDEAVVLLGSWGLDVVLMDHARGTHEHFAYLAAVDSARARDFMRGWLDPDVAGVFAARGGYGSQRMVDLLDWQAIAEAGPKVLLGFSDVTALHQAFASRLGMVTVHGPVLTSLVSGEEATREHLRRLLFEPAPMTLTPEPVDVVVPGRAEGVLVGGNLALVAAELGTRNSSTAADSIAVLEDVGEDLYRLDRLVTQLLRAGWFQRVRGIALGQFTDCGAPASVRSLMRDRLGPLGVPMLWGVPVGHGPANLAFPFGVPATIDADAGTLRLDSAGLL